LNSETYTYLLAHPQKINSKDLGALGHIIDTYPYFQSARALQLKGLKNGNSFMYNEALKVTAAHTTDRDMLFEYITSETFIQNEISQKIMQHDAVVNEMEVITENVSEEISVNLDNKMKAELKKAEAILNPDLFERKVASVEHIVEEAIIPALESEKREAEQTLEIESPLPFTKQDTHSFSEWLKLTQAQPIERKEDEVIAEQPAVSDEKDRKIKLIENFIQQRPKLHPPEKNKPTKNQQNLAARYTQAPSALMTETLAKVYLQQKNYSKAIQAYKILILKYPEKSGFFADQIRAIEKTIQTEEK